MTQRFDHAELMEIAQASVRGFRLQPADRDDAAQEAAVGMYRKLANLRPDASPDEQRGYLYRVGRSKALNYLAWRSRTGAREVHWRSSGPDGDQQERDGIEVAQANHERRQGRPAVPTPEEELGAVGLGAAIACVAAVAASGDEEGAQRAAAAFGVGYSRLSSQEAALFRYKLGVEDMRDDLERLGKGPRGSVSNRARRKLLAAAEEAGALDVVTPDLLLRVFGPRED